MAAAKRIYAVTDGTTTSLVRAATQSQAIAHVVKSKYKAVVPTQDELVKLVSDGVGVETAGEEAE